MPLLRLERGVDLAPQKHGVLVVNTVIDVAPSK